MKRLPAVILRKRGFVDLRGINRPAQSPPEAVEAPQGSSRSRGSAMGSAIDRGYLADQFDPVLIRLLLETAPAPVHAAADWLEGWGPTAVCLEL